MDKKIDCSESNKNIVREILRRAKEYQKDVQLFLNQLKIHIDSNEENILVKMTPIQIKTIGVILAELFEIIEANGNIDPE